MGETVQFPSNGNTASGYLAHPSSGAGPGVIVIQEWWGLVHQIEKVCDRLAAEGFTALAPDLYHGKVAAHAEPDKAGEIMMALPVDRAARDMGGAVDFLKNHASVRGDGVGVIGFCMGGGLALWLATLRPDAIKACVPYYGIIPWGEVQPDYSKINGAVQGHIAEEDEFFPVDQARALEKQLSDLGKEVEFFYYPGTTHAFANEERKEVHHEDASRQAWVRTLEFLRAKLG
jgi:carboxymethylenebutenolidase